MPQSPGLEAEVNPAWSVTQALSSGACKHGLEGKELNKEVCIGQHQGTSYCWCCFSGGPSKEVQGGVWFLLHHLLMGQPSPAGLTHVTTGMTECCCWPRSWSSARRLALLEFM